MAVTGTTVLGGRYTLLAVLGTGGMATVWRARDEMLGRDVAVKVLSPQHAADPGWVARFEGEARHAAAVSHVRLVTVFDCGLDGGTPFIVMELVEGRTLRQVLDNIVLNGGAVKVLDFGIARADATRAATAAGTVVGTVAYLSPEQASGGQADPRSDLYSLGCVLFEMLTGRPPFTADSMVGLAYRQVHDDPGLPSAWRPGLPAGLDRITAQLLAKDPVSRPPTAAAARAGLLSVFAPAGGTPDSGTAVLPVTPGPVPGALRRGWHPRPAEAALGAALAASLIALLAVLLAGGPGGGNSAASGLPSASLTASPSAATSSPPAQPGTTLSPVAAAAATFVGDLKQGVADGQVAPQAGQNLFNQLQQLLFQPGQGSQQVQQQYSQLVQAYTQDKSQGQITGPAARSLPSAISALGAALGTL